MEQVEAVVIGAGIVGSATARALAARGVRTAWLEQFGAGHSRGSSHGATRIFRLAYPDPCYVRMALAAQRAWDRLQAEAGERLLVVTGGLDAGPGAHACASALAAAAAAHCWLDGAELSARFPGIAAAPGERMLFQPDAGVCLADRAVAALRRLADIAGAPLRAQTPALTVHPRRDGAVVRTPVGDIAADVVVVAAGAWTASLLAGAVNRVPQLTPTLQQVRHYAPRGGGGAAWPTLIDWQEDGAAWYAVPQAGGAPGVKVAKHAPGPPVDPAQGPFAVDPAQDGAADGYVRERLPGLAPAGHGSQTCLYTMTSDEDFVLDREGPVVVGAGGSGHAFKFGPLLGETLARLALGEPADIPRERFSLSRATLEAPPRVR